MPQVSAVQVKSVRKGRGKKNNPPSSVLPESTETASRTDLEDFDLKHRAALAQLKFQKYYPKLTLSPFYPAAMIFDPTVRTGFLEPQFGKERATEILASVRDAFDKFQQNWESNHDQNESQSAYEPVQEKKEMKQDTYHEIMKEINERMIRTAPLSNEFDRYINEGSYEIEEKKNPIQWWALDTQRQKFPILSRFALFILSIPAMSDEPERIFSGARRTISWERARLGVQAIEHIECLKSYFRNMDLLIR